MAKVKNHVLYPSSDALLYELKKEYEWLGRDVIVSEGDGGKKLIILALPKKYARKTRQQAKLRAKRETKFDNYDGDYPY